MVLPAGRSSKCDYAEALLLCVSLFAHSAHRVALDHHCLALRLLLHMQGAQVVDSLAMAGYIKPAARSG